MTTQRDTAERLRGFAWPAMLVGGLLLVLLAQVQWGWTEEGVEPSITGLGHVKILGATTDDVEFFFADKTDDPGLSVVVAGAVIAVVAALGWWRTRLRPSAVGLIGLASLIALVVGVRTLSDPAAQLFSDSVSEALGAELPAMQPGYGLIGTVVVAVLLLAVVAGWVLTTLLSRPTVSRTGESS
ncbi:hypothetical protein [Gordonia terrae]|uniref:hypothetical protein n=1 Tax=Gordonia terrae TaxID=2055 RepID=UPI003F6BCB40